MTLDVATEEERPDPSFFLHNLRNYVGSLVNSSERLKADRSDERALAIITKASNLALRDLLAFTDLSRPLDLKLQPINLGQWTRSLLESHEASKKLTLAWELPEADVVAHVDPAQFKEAVLAIVANSVEAMPDGGTLAVGVCQSPEGWSCLWLQDRGGPVIRDVTLEMIGCPFFTLKPERLGLGLSRARHIVHQHGGRMEIGRSPLGGLRIDFMLPPASPV